jgi:AraC family transcriptional regulator, regulatory protein of adaptative response / methylated-DNA-[protein]-cysteine methyltransferase
MKIIKASAPLQSKAEVFLVFGQVQAKISPAIAAWLGSEMIFLALTSEIQSLQSFLKRRFPNWPQRKADRSELNRLKDYLDLAIHDDTTPLPWSVLLVGTPFEHSVWNAMAILPPKTFTTYKKIAESIGNAKALRAVGSAVGRNPISIAIPCHRVISSNGSLGGYAWGLALKKVLIGKN